MGDFLSHNASRLLVLAAFVALLIFAHHSAAHPEEASFSAFCTSKAGECLAAFLALITGGVLAGGNGNGKGTPPPNQPPPSKPGV